MENEAEEMELEEDKMNPKEESGKAGGNVGLMEEEEKEMGDAKTSGGENNGKAIRFKKRDQKQTRS